MRNSALAPTRWTVAVLVALVLGLAPVLAPGLMSVVHADDAMTVEASDELLISGWNADGEAMLDALGVAVTADQQACLREQIEEIGLSMVFWRDGTATINDSCGVSGLPESATWTTVSREAARMVVMLLDATQPNAVPRTLTIDFSTPFGLALTIDSLPFPLFMTGGVEMLQPLVPHALTGEPLPHAGPTNLHGVWVADWANFLEEATATMSPDEATMMRLMISSTEVTFTFADDGTVVMHQNSMGQSETKNGTWAFESAAANTVIFVFTETPVPGEAQEPPQRFTATFESTDNMTMTMEGDPQVIPFYRQ